MLAIAVLLVAAPAVAADGSIDHVQSNDDGQIQVLYSLPGVGEAVPDLSTVHVTLDGSDVPATTSLASEAGNGSVRRTAVLAIDVSRSMAVNGKFEAAKRAAGIFLDSVPDDLYVGVVTFAGTVAVAQEPSLDRAASKSVIGGLKLSLGTRLYDGLIRAVSTSGPTGQRSVIVLSDGRDTSDTRLSTAADRVKSAGVKVDVVALAQSARDESLLAPLSEAGGGSVISAADPTALGNVFASEAQTLAKQILVTASPPATATVTEGTLRVAVDAGDERYLDAAFVRVRQSADSSGSSTAGDLQPASPGVQLTSTQMLVALGAAGVGLLVVLMVVVGAIGRKSESLESKISAYTGRGRLRPQKAQQQSVASQAVGLADKALKSNQGMEARLGSKLESGGLSLKPAEWLLIHAGCAVGVAAVLFLLTGGGPLTTLVGLVLGIIVPWVYLGRRQSRRLKAFNAQLAGTLQLMAGSLQAGLSLPQGMDTIVREGAEPVSAEFRRALVETRLGVSVEDALESVAQRMTSDDFEWTVMAIRIQREVGGNLSELLLNVAATLRERDYLRRQVKSLSAEGRFSAYILLALPPCILAYEAVTNADYLRPLYSTGIGFAMLGAMGLLMGLGAFTMSRMIKLEV